MKKLLAFFMALSLLLCTAAVGWAAESTRFLQTVLTQEDSLKVYMDTLTENGDISVTLGGQELSHSARTVEEAGEPVTYYCLVDISGTMYGSPLTLAKAVLLGISERLKPNDNMVVTTFCNNIAQGEVLAAGDELTQTIKKLQVGEGDTSLYSAIVECIGLMSRSSDFHTKKCLVVCSDGVECQDNGATEAEVLLAVQEADFPIYTFATMTETTQLDGGKIMGSFARSSAGGQHFTTADEEGGGRTIRWDVSGDEIAAEICTDMESGEILTVDLAGYTPEAGRNEVSLNVTVTGDTGTQTETRNLSADDLPAAATPAPTAEPTPVPTAEPTPTPSPDIDPDPSWLEEHKTLVICGSCVAAVLIAALAALLVIKNKEKNSKKTGNGQGFEVRGKVQYANPAVTVDPPRPQRKEDIPVYMVEIPYARHSASFGISSSGDSCVIGRNDKADVVLNATDSQLSGRHFALACNKGTYYVSDQGSKNGTILNGVRIISNKWTKIASGDKIRVGGIEYRILFGDDIPHKK